jgi:hypothetical protein
VKTVNAVRLQQPSAIVSESPDLLKLLKVFVDKAILTIDRCCALHYLASAVRFSKRMRRSCTRFATLGIPQG